MLIPEFIGREKELDTLKECWKAASDGVPQIVNLIADTGVGKTRIVHAFYEWLSAEAVRGCAEGQRAYWPNSLGVSRLRSVNPGEVQFGAFDFEKDLIPWLWWGLYWTDVDNEQTVALTQFSGFLSNHLTMLELEQKTKQKNFKAAVQAVADESFDFVSDFLPGISQVKKLATLLFKLKASHEEKRQRSLGLGVEQKNQINDIQEDILQRLDILCSSKENTPAVPLILFLDDIHFATDKLNDGATLVFLENLSNKAANNKWPLLVITTHWKSPWQAHLNDVSLSECRPWRRIVETLRERFRDDRMQEHKLQIHDVYLENIIKDDLKAVIQSTIPGLNESNRNSILERVDNVRWLVEVLTTLYENSDYFEQSDRTQALSKHGQEHFDMLVRSNGYLDVIRQRLRSDNMKQLRPILGAAAWYTHGLDFIGAFVYPIGQALTERQVLAGNSGNIEKMVFELVIKAIDSSAFLEGSVPYDVLPSLLSFSERGYMDVARELFEPRHLPSVRLALAREVIAWLQTSGFDEPRWMTLTDTHERRVFLEIARMVLQDVMPRLTEEQETILQAKAEAYKELVNDSEMSQAKMVEKIETLRQKFLSENESELLEGAKLWFVCCTIELIKLINDAGEARAFKLAYELSSSCQLDEVEYLHVSTDALIALTEIFKEKKGCWAQARNIIESLINKYEVLQGTPEGLKQLSLFLLCQAELDIKSGDIAGARHGFAQCVTIAERLIEEFGATPLRLLLLSVYLVRTADLHKASGKMAFARQGYVQSLAIYERLIEEFDETPQLLRDLSLAVDRIADLDAVAGNILEARHGCVRFLEITARLIEEFGETPQRLDDLGMARRRIADLDIEVGEIALARQGYSQCLTIYERLIEEFGETPNRLSNKSVALERIADLDTAAGEMAAAHKGVVYCLEIHKHLIKEFGETPERLRDQGVVIGRMADLDKALGKMAFARQGYVQSLAIYERLIEEFDETPQLLRDLSLAVERIADLDAIAGNILEARHGHVRCLDIANRLIQKFDETPELLRDQSVSLERIAALDKTVGGITLARHGYVQCLEIHKRIVREFGVTPGRLRDLSVSLGAIADLDKAVGDIAAARQGYVESWAINDRLIKEFDETPDRLRDLTIALLRIADLDKAVGDSATARQGYVESLAIYERLIKEFGETPERMRDLTIALLRITDLDKAVGDLAEARQVVMYCIEIAQYLIEKFGETPQRLRDLSLALVRIADLDTENGEIALAQQVYDECIALTVYQVAEYGETLQRLQDMEFFRGRIAQLNNLNGFS